MRKRKIILIFFISFFLQGFPFFSQSPIVAKLNKTTVRTGEHFTYTITVKGAFKKPTLRLPDFKNLTIISQSQSREYIKVKNKKTLKTTIEFVILSNKPQVVKIGSALLTDGKKRYKSKGLIIKIIGEPLSEDKNLKSYIEAGEDI
jgi:hypothetical protein